MKTSRSDKEQVQLSVLVSLLIMCVVVFQTGCTMLKANNDQVPPETKKIVETRHYKAIKQGQEWVCGDEITDGSRYERSIIYYDQYGNELLKKSLREDSSIWREERRYYYDAKVRKLSKFVEKWDMDDGLELKVENIYIRDDEGRLMQIKKIKGDNESFEYDTLGRRIKEVEGDKTTHISYYMSCGYEYAYYCKYDRNCKYADGKVEEKYVFRDEGTGKVDREVYIFYKYGYIDEIKETKWEYNDAGICVSVFETTWNKVGRFYIEVPSGLDLYPEEREKYIKETYYDNEPRLHKLETRHSVYNDYGDIISDISCLYNYGDDPVHEDLVFSVAVFYGLRGFGEASASPSSKSSYSYDYNEKGDYVKCIVSDESFGSTFRTIIIREITYL